MCLLINISGRKNAKLGCLIVMVMFIAFAGVYAFDPLDEFNKLCVKNDVSTNVFKVVIDTKTLNNEAIEYDTRVVVWDRKKDGIRLFGIETGLDRVFFYDSAVSTNIYSIEDDDLYSIASNFFDQAYKLLYIRVHYTNSHYNSINTAYYQPLSGAELYWLDLWHSEKPPYSRHYTLLWAGYFGLYHFRNDPEKEEYFDAMKNYIIMKNLYQQCRRHIENNDFKQKKYIPVNGLGLFFDSVGLEIPDMIYYDKILR